MATQYTDEQQEKWLDEYAHDITGSNWIDQEEDEWGNKSICIAGGGSHACYIEVCNERGFRYNWVCRHETQKIDNLYVIDNDDGCEYITDKKPPEGMFEDVYSL